MIHQELIKLSKPVHSGDWHDAPLRYSVVSKLPAGDEAQLFSTKAQALRYARIRNRSANQVEAIKEFCR